MSKERLEELKKKTTGKDYLWAIKYAKEQAERVQELERQQKKNDDYTWKLLMDIKRYREAKKQIEEKYEYFQDVPSSVSTGLSMAIEILDKALEGEE